MSGTLFANEDSADDDVAEAVDERFGVDPLEEHDRLIAINSAKHLGQLFDEKHQETSTTSTTLSYVPPKQPEDDATPSENETKTDGKQRVVFAAAIHAFVLHDSNFVSKGKVGMVVLAGGNTEAKLLMYFANKKPLCQVIFNLNFRPKFDNEYVSFYDQRNVYWSILFEEEESKLDFAKIVLSLLSQFVQSDPLLIDTTLGEGYPVEIGESIEVNCTQYSVGNNLANIRETNSQRGVRAKLGKGRISKVWESSIVGMKKNGKRLFLTTVGDERLKGEVVSAIMCVELKRVKHAKSESNDNEQTLSTDPARGTSPDAISEGDVSISDTTALPDVGSGKSDNRDLISRMAKIGRPLMPIILKRDNNANNKPDETTDKEHGSDADKTAETLQQPASLVRMVDKIKENSDEKRITNHSVVPSPDVTIYQPNVPMQSNQVVPQLIMPLPSTSTQAHASGQPFAFVPYPVAAAPPSLSDEDLSRIVEKLSEKLQKSSLPAVEEMHRNVATINQAFDSKVQTLSSQISQIQSSIEKLSEQKLQDSSIVTTKSEEEMATKIKRIMSRFYKAATGEFPQGPYSSEYIQQRILFHIKKTTVSELGGTAEDDKHEIDCDYDDIMSVLSYCVENVSNASENQL